MSSVVCQFTHSIIYADIVLGVRNSSQILIHIDIQKALDSGLKFYLSDNGVVLSEGDVNGFVAPEFFKRVETANHVALPGWEGPMADIHEVLTENLPCVDTEEEGIHKELTEEVPP